MYIYSKRIEKIKHQKETNAQNEKVFLNERTSGNTIKTNSWDKVIDNITLKESEYKGTKDVSRMRNVIINRKNDGNNNNIK